MRRSCSKADSTLSVEMSMLKQRFNDSGSSSSRLVTWGEQQSSSAWRGFLLESSGRPPDLPAR